MNPNPYQMVIYWSKEDLAYLVEVPELPGCMADGKTRQEALANAETIIAEWVETAHALGRPVPIPGERFLTTSETAKRLGLSLAMVRRYCLNGKPPARKIGRDWIILERDVEHFATSPRHSGRPPLRYTARSQGAHIIAEKREK
jgi:excisionase family DNA binding protein